MFLGQQGICQLISLSFRVIVNWFSCLPSGKGTPWYHPGKCLKNIFFLGESRNPCQGTKTDCKKV